MKIRAYLIDTLGNVLFWVPIVAVLEYIFLGFTVEQIIGVSIIGVIINATLGGPFGIFINRWRKLFNV